MIPSRSPHSGAPRHSLTGRWARLARLRDATTGRAGRAAGLALLLLGGVLGGCGPGQERGRGGADSRSNPGSVPTDRATADTRPAATEGVAAARSPEAAPDRPAPPMEITLVDHATFRRFSPEPEVYEAEMRRLRANLDAAQARGIHRYVIFGRELEKLLTYDFALEGAGPLGRLAFPEGGDARREAALYRDLMRWAIDEAAAREIALVLHSNQIELPEPILAAVQGLAAEGETICADREITWALYRAKLGELFEALPGLAGLQVTADETGQGLGRCDGPEAGVEDDLAAEALAGYVDRLLNETARIARGHDIDIEGRSWGRIYALEEQLDPARMFQGLDPDISLSLKNTRGDFHLFSPPSPLIGQGDGARQILELDAWREHQGWNLYPCYMGDIWAPRIAAAREAGIRRLALRIAWDQPEQPLFEVPWGNRVNLELLRGLARDPRANPDSLLRDWIARAWPEGSREAAFALYKQSPALLGAVHAQGSESATDHSRLFRLRDEGNPFERIDSRLKWLNKAGELQTPEDFTTRRAAIDAAYAETSTLVDALGDAAPEAWRAALARGARSQWHIGRGSTDQLELRFWTREAAPEPPEGRLSAIVSQALSDNADWRAESPDHYALMEGAQLPAMIEALADEG